MANSCHSITIICLAFCGASTQNTPDASFAGCQPQRHSSTASEVARSDDESVSVLQLGTALGRSERSRSSNGPSCSLVGQRDGPPIGTSCPDAKWLDEMVRADPSPAKTLVSIGCNKGNDIIRMMEMWDMSKNRFWSQEKWNNQMKKRGMKPSAYACPSTGKYLTSFQVNPNSTDTAVPTGVCVEPMLNNVRALASVSKTLGYAHNTPYGAFHVVQAAVVASAPANGMLQFPNAGPGTEDLHLGKGNAEVYANAGLPPLHSTQVPAKTLDTIMEDLGLHHVDVLSIDTEGYDPDVLKGGKRTLANVRYLEVEVHRDLVSTPWATTSLRSVIDDLHGHGFDCYWAHGIGKLTDIRACWTDDFEFGTWANAACVKRNDVWSEVMKNYAV